VPETLTVVKRETVEGNGYPNNEADEACDLRSVNDNGTHNSLALSAVHLKLNPVLEALASMLATLLGRSSAARTRCPCPGPCISHTGTCVWEQDVCVPCLGYLLQPLNS
jgi:hypothetical protein